MAKCYAGYRSTRLQALLDEFSVKWPGLRGSFAHGNPDDKGDIDHVFLSGQHRHYGWDRGGDFSGRLPFTNQ